MYPCLYVYAYVDVDDVDVDVDIDVYVYILTLHRMAVLWTHMFPKPCCTSPPTLNRSVAR